MLVLKNISFLFLGVFFLCACKREQTPDSLGYITQHQLAPAEFGLQVLKQQMACAELKMAMNTAQQELDNLTAKKATAIEIQAAAERLKDAKAMYQARQKEIEIMLAVIGMESPE